jgi:hypothetical protein
MWHNGWKNVRDTISAWYEGEHVPWKNEPHSNLVFVNSGDLRRHWTASVAHVLSKFWIKHWQWIVGVVIAIAALIINARR